MSFTNGEERRNGFELGRVYCCSGCGINLRTLVLVWLLTLFHFILRRRGISRQVNDVFFGSKR
ncbi:MAG: hypothetical protein ISS58_07410 [Dehalococcoidales bacterium]|nr:hypothetical protein [Dehalococcoidales bacterium]